MNVVKMTTDELAIEKDRHERDLVNIKNDIDTARRAAASSGVYSDANWFNRATIAQRIKGREHQEIIYELGQRRKAERVQAASTRNETWPAIFVDMARKHLSPNVFKFLRTETDKENDKKLEIEIDGTELKEATR